MYRAIHTNKYVAAITKMKSAKNLNIGKQLKYSWISQRPNLNHSEVLEQFFF